ncbi:MAG: DUF1638 domain-containing protein [Phycisphaerales bacterium]|nr:DUF1638 domain-containing protein [Phycisphaerales bacterium]
MLNTVKPKVAVVLCAVLKDEFAALAASRPHVLHSTVLKQGLHDTPTLLQSTLQETINQVEALDLPIEAIVLGYGLCSRGTEGITSRKYKVVLPRAHDCITLLLGSKERYANYVKEHPGCYWYSPGWISDHVLPGPERYATMRRQYVEKYGEENADFLMESEQAWYQSYTRGAYVDTGLTSPESVEKDIAYTKRCTDWLKWQFDRVHGSAALMEALLDGRWDEEDFLVLEPGQVARMTADERIVTAVSLPNGEKVVV